MDNLTLKSLYGDNANPNLIKQRYDQLYKSYADNFGSVGEYYFSSPGRVEICGNHTDHNNGKVLVAAINCDTLALVSKTNNNYIQLHSKGYPDIKVNINDLSKKDNELSTSIALVRGVLKAFTDRNLNIGAFNACVDSTVFKGAGVSSSASYEVLIAKILSHLFNNDSVAPFVLAQVSQYAENVYFGKPCGLLDQCGIAFGGLTSIDFCDTNNPIVQTMRPIDTGRQMILVNTRGNHSKLTPAYASIKEDMAAVANFFNCQVLRQVDYNQFISSMPQLINAVSGRAILRANHFFEENIRVSNCIDAIQTNNTEKFLHNIEQSGLSSYTQLQNCYIAADKTQSIPLALNISKAIDKSAIVRVHGGGFSGTILTFIKSRNVDNYKMQMSKIFGSNNVLPCQIRACGATIVNK